MKNKNIDMTRGVIWKAMVSFAVPIFLGQLFQQLYNTADSVIVGQFVGKDALAAVASSGNLIFMMTGFFIGLFVGAGVIISRYFGAKDYKKVETAVHTDVAFACLCGIFLTVVGVIFTPKILILMRTPENVLPVSTLYFRIYFWGSFSNIMYNALMGILNAVGNSKTPLYYLIVSSVTNVILDLIFVGVFNFGVAGAAVATVISQTISAILCFIKLLKSNGPEKICVRQIKIDGSMLKKILGQGIPSGIQNSIISIANVVVQSNINSFGSDVMAGCGSYSKTEGFIFLPINSLTMAITTFIGQNIGAGEYERAKRGARFGILSTMASAELLGIMLYKFCPYIIRIFNDDPAVVDIGVAEARTMALFYFALAFGHGVAAVLRGAGRAKVPMYTMLVCWCIIRVIYVTVALRFFPVINTVFWAYPITWLLSCTVFFIYYIKVDWVHSFDRL